MDRIGVGAPSGASEDQHTADRLEQGAQVLRQAAALVVRLVLLPQHDRPRAAVDRGRDDIAQRPGALRPVREHEQRRQLHRSGSPCIDVEASAFHRRGMRPAPREAATSR